MALIHRFTHPFVALLPDLTDVPARRQAVGALIASVVLHLLVLLLIVGAATLMPAHKPEFARPKPQLQELEPQLEMTIFTQQAEPLQIVQPEDLLQPRSEPQYIDSTGLAKSDEKPAEAIFQSDQDMIAASEKEATGDAPLPSIDGRDLPFTNFTTQEAMLGSAKAEPSPANVSLTPPAPPAPAAPIFKPQPVPPEQVTASTPAPDQPLPKPAERVQPQVARATPRPLPEVKAPDENQIALAEKTDSTPEPVTRVQPPPRPQPVPIPPQPMAPPMPQTREEMAKLTTPAPPQRPLPKPGFQSQQEQSKIDGSITNRGKAAVDAVRTPLAVYKKQVNSAIGSRWYYYVRQRRDLIAFGSVKMSYAITTEGKIVDVRVVSNTSNQSLAAICEQSIREAEIGPPPEEAQASMTDGRLEGDLTFTYYDLH